MLQMLTTTPSAEAAAVNDVKVAIVATAAAVVVNIVVLVSTAECHPSRATLLSVVGNGVLFCRVKINKNFV
jgi:hypothetical protein